MSLVLGIDTCTRWTSIGCTVDGEVIGEMNLKMGTHQSAQLPDLVDRLLHDLGKNITDIDLIAAGTGPGYFTGVRIGLAYSAALAEALGVFVVPVPTLEALIADLPPGDTLYVPVLWARREHVYFAAYRRHPEGFYPFSPPAFRHNCELTAFLQSQSGPVAWVGETPQRCGLPSEGITTCWNRTGPRGGNVALLGALRKSQAERPVTIRADYLRDPDIGRT